METIIEKTEERQRMDITKFKNDIKELSEQQRFLKNQRKTVKLVGERKIKSSEATWKHQANRDKLRLMYAAYGLMRGKSFSQTENKYPEENHPLNEYKLRIGKIIASYVLEEKIN
jgi:hypothetical protein